MRSNAMMGFQAGSAAAFDQAMWVGAGVRGWRADGTDGQEDELQDVHKGILDAPTDDEGPGSVDDGNRHPNAPPHNRRETLEDLERKAGFRPIIDPVPTDFPKN